MTRSPAQIERDLAETRRDMARTINELQTRVSPRRMLNSTLDTAKRAVSDVPRTAGHEISEFGKDFASGLGAVVRHHPIPVAMVGIGLAWLVISGQRSRRHRTADVAAAEPRTVPAAPLPATPDTHPAPLPKTAGGMSGSTAGTTGSMAATPKAGTTGRAGTHPFSREN